MKFEPREVTLKNGAKATIREATKKDARALADRMLEFVQTCSFTLISKDEFFPTKRNEADRMERLCQSSNSILLVAEQGKEIIGCLELKGENRKKTRHNASLGLMVAPKWQNTGVGSLLLQSAVSWAAQHPVLENLWLDVFANHHQAIHLYEKLGFQSVGTRWGYIKDGTGQPIDQITMFLRVISK